MEVQAVQCICCGIQRMPGHHAHNRQPIYNIDPSWGALVALLPPYHQVHSRGGAPNDSAPAAQ